MKSDQILRSVLDEEITALTKLSFSELSDIGKPIFKETLIDDVRVQIAIEILERNPEYVHVMVSVDDGRLIRSIVPLSSSFLKYIDGRIDA